MKNKFIDANIFLRYLTKDDPVKYEKCYKLFKDAVDGKVILFTSKIVIAELVWTLNSFYKVPKNDIIEKVSIIISTENLHIPSKEIIIDAIILYGRKNIDFIDAYNAVFMKYNQADEIYSYDHDFDNLEDITRLEP